MLVLSRRPGEALYVGEVKIVVLEKRRSGAVKLGIAAPPEMRITREEHVQSRADEQGD